MRRFLQRARRAYRAWLETPPSARPILVRSYGILGLCRLRLSLPGALGGAALWRAEWERARPEGAVSPPEDELVEVFGRAAAAHVPALPCLVRAVALRRLLRGYGIETQLVIGMRRSASGLEAHAWVERNGVVLADDESQVRSFLPFRRAA